MDQLHLVGVHEDGEHLIVESTDSQRYSLKIDQQLRQAVQHARKKTPARGRVSGQFGPRDIQARFRAGASVEDIVAESGWEPERVKRYEWPILAERGHMVREALKVKVTGTSPSHDGYRSVFEGEPRTLEQTVHHRAQDTGVAVSSLDWDAWQREDQLWSLQLTFSVSDRDLAPHDTDGPAEWTYNPASQTVRPVNDWASTLGQEPHETGPLGVPAPTVTHHPAPDARVEQLQREASQADELLDVLQARRGRRLGSDTDEDDRLAEILGRGMGHVDNRPRPIGAPEDSPLFDQPIQPAAARVAEDRALEEDAGIEIVDDSTVEPEEPEAPEEEADQAASTSLPDAVTAGRGPQLTVAGDLEDSVATLESKDETAPIGNPPNENPTGGNAVAQNSEVDQEQTSAEPTEPPRRAPGPRGRTGKAKRSSVPSWDEIVFGSNSN
ncbi:septation protein SepH [Kocuria sp. cx-455]|uniref:septation protein SepH n=1 Tax=Kocuria sp. cx-455 TaxID=2771377 RepID=UPI003D748911